MKLIKILVAILLIISVTFIKWYDDHKKSNYIDIKESGVKGHENNDLKDMGFYKKCNQETKKIQKLIYNLKPGQTLVVTKGNYILTDDLIVPNNVTVVFEKDSSFYFYGGYRGLVLGSDDVIKNLRIFEGRKYNDIPNKTMGVTIKNKKNITLIGGEVNGFTFSNISINNSKNVELENIISTNAGTKNDGQGTWEGNGIYITNKSENISLCNSLINNNGKHGFLSWSDGRVLSSKGIKIVNCRFQYNGDSGIVLTCTDTFKILNNLANNNGNNGGPYGGQGIQVVGTYSNHTSKNGKIKLNSTYNNTENGIEIIGNVINVDVENNRTKGNIWSGIKVSNHSSKLDIKSNISNHNGLHGIDIRDSKQIELVDNSTNYNSENGVVLKNTYNSLITNFVSKNNGQLEKNRSGIEINRGGDNKIINGQIGNMLKSTQDFGVRNYNSVNLEIKNIN